MCICSSKPRALDFFCGIGGLSSGLELAGFNVVGGIDNWEQALNTFSKNHNKPAMLADITKLTRNEIENYFSIDAKNIDLLAGGPPCQGFSTIGNRDDNDSRNNLVFVYIKHVLEFKPKYFIMENVNGILLAKNRKLCSIIKSEVARHGYHMKFKEVVSADYGVPQLRKRVIFVGWKDGLSEFVFPSPSQKTYVTVREAIYDLPHLESGQSADEYGVQPFSEYQRWARNGCTVLHNHEAANHSKELIEIISHIPDGGNRKSIPDELQPKSGFHNSYARLDSNKPAIAVTSNMRKPSSARATHPHQNRGLTVREGLRLQSFKDDFIVYGSRTDQYLQVGNAVPPLLGYAIGKSVMKALRVDEDCLHGSSRIVGKGGALYNSAEQLKFSV